MHKEYNADINHRARSWVRVLDLPFGNLIITNIFSFNIGVPVSQCNIYDGIFVLEVAMILFW